MRADDLHLRVRSLTSGPDNNRCHRFGLQLRHARKQRPTTIEAGRARRRSTPIGRGAVYRVSVEAIAHELMSRGRTQHDGQPS